MKRLSEKRLYELSRWINRDYGVSCAICGKRIKKHDGKKYCCECAVSFGRDFDYSLVIDNKIYTPFNPKDTMPVSKLESGKYIMVYRKHYVIVDKDSELMKLIKLNLKMADSSFILKNSMFSGVCSVIQIITLKVVITN